MGHLDQGWYVIYVKHICFILSLLLPTLYLDSKQRVVTYIGPRSQATNAARDHIGQTDYMRAITTDNLNTTVHIVGEVTKSFRPERIVQSLFGQDRCEPDKLTISGSRVEKRIRNQEWLADYFGLPTDFISTINFRPQTNNVIIEPGLTTTYKKWYASIQIPLVYTNWDLNMEERIIQSGSNSHDAGYFTDTTIERDQLLPNATSFLQGASAPQVSSLIFHPLTFATMNPRSQRIFNIAEIKAVFGRDVWSTDRYHVQIDFRSSIPAGNRPEALFLFEPIVGNGHHWELGVGFFAQVDAWTDSTTEQRVNLYARVNVTHLFSTTQHRTFDLKQKPNSRYMLAQKLATTVIQNLTGERNNIQIPSPAQFDHEIAPVAQITTFPIRVHNNVQIDSIFMITYTKETLSWTFGYGVWKRSSDRITIKNNVIKNNQWALKGDNHLFGFVGEQNNPEDLPLGTAISLAATTRAATINAGTNLPKQGIGVDNQDEKITRAKKNPVIDNPTPAFAGNTQLLVASIDNVDQKNQINTSIPPHVIRLENIDITSAQTKGATQKVYSHFNRVWTTPSNRTAYIGIGAEIDFGQEAHIAPETTDPLCPFNSALSYWGVWLKGGCSF